MPDFGRAGTGYGSAQDTFDAAGGKQDQDQVEVILEVVGMMRIKVL